MAKDTFYFSHDYNSRADEKIKLLIRKHGFLGYGIFWAIIEDLYNNANALRTDYEGIAFDLRVDIKIVKSVINDFDLFIIKDDFFGSFSVQRRLEERSARSKKARESANYRWSKLKDDANALKDDANAMRTQCDSNAIKERKGKESKVKEIKDNKDIDLIKNEISKLSNNYAEENFRAFEKWRDYLEKQHDNFLKENIYTYQILQNAIKTIGASKFVQAVNFSIESNYKKIYPRPEARQQERVTAQAAKRDSDF